MISEELFPGLMQNFSFWPASYLYLFFEISVYFTKACFLAFRNCSFKALISSKGFGILFGGKNFGFFTFLSSNKSINLLSEKFTGFNSTLEGGSSFFFGARFDEFYCCLN